LWAFGGIGAPFASRRGFPSPDHHDRMLHTNEMASDNSMTIPNQRSREMVAQAKEQVHDIVAEVHAEDDAAKAASNAVTEAQKL
jgi:hypothetical protein